MADRDGEGPNTGVQSVTPNVFISYASQDAAIATTVVEALERSGVACWIAPRDVTPGAFYADEIVHAIDAAKAVVLILSQNAADSQHVLREVERAASKRHPLVSLRVDQAPLPAGLEYFLNTSQWLDASGGDIAHCITKLIVAVRVAIQAPAVTPGAAPTPRDPAPLSPARPQKRTAIIVASLIALAIAGFAVESLWVSSRQAAPTPLSTVKIPAPTAAPVAAAIPERSVAVLPFADMSEKKDQEYFSDGMAEEVLDLLAKVPGLQVIGRTSSFQFKGQNADLRTVGAKLNVAYVVEGSVRRAGDRVRVTAQLIDTRSGSHRWSDTYDRDFSDILKVQGEIAASLVRALQLELMPSVLDEPRPSLSSGQAYDMYLRGLHALEQRDQAGLEGAVADFRRALELDPSFASAADMLARTQINLVYWGFVPARTGFQQARAAAEAALMLNSNSPYAHGVLCSVYTEGDWNWGAAERESRTIVGLAPKNPAVLLYAADERMAIGRLAEALQMIDAALTADPLDPELYMERSWIYERLGRLVEAESDARRVLEISPTFAWAHYYLGVILLTEHKADAALAEMRKETSNGMQQAGLSLTYYALHRVNDADAALARLQADNADDMAMAIAEAYAFRGRKDQAFKWLERAFAQKDINLYYVKGDPLLKNIEPDPRYKAFLRKMNLPE